MKKLKFIYLVLLSFGLILLSYSAEVNALVGWEYYEESPFNVPSTDDFEADIWYGEDIYGLEWSWNFTIPIELEYNVSLQDIKVVVIDDFFVELFLDDYQNSGQVGWREFNAADYFDYMSVECDMILHDEEYLSVIDISNDDILYDLLTTGYVFYDVNKLYPSEKIIYRIDFVFEISFSMQWEEIMDIDKIRNDNHQYQIEIYYNSSVYADVYEKGLDDGYEAGYDDGYDDGYYDGLLESDVAEAYLQGYQDGEKSKLAENNAAFYSGIGKWLVPAVITVIVLGGIMSIVAIKRREQ